MPATWVSKEKIQTIWGMLHNIRIRMQENIKTPSVTATGTGLQASINIALPKSAAGNEYNGFLKVIQTAPDKLKIVDGFDPDNDNCWEGMINGFDCTCLAKEITISNELEFIYMSAAPTGGSGTAASPWTGAYCLIQQAGSMPAFENNMFKHLISRVSLADGKITGFTEEGSFSQGFILRKCFPEEASQS